MDKQVILAVAGAGKTYHICNNFDENKRNLIIAYTNQNIRNILTEILLKYKRIPENTFVMTYHSFIYKFMIRPFDSIIGELYGKSNFSSDGISICDPPVQSIKVGTGYRPNPYYNPISTLEHYLHRNRYYSAYLSKVILKTKNKNISIIDTACENINKFFDTVYIDEMQDFREENWELLVNIIKRINNIMLVGDYYQHSVSAINNTGLPFKNKKLILNYNEYIQYLKNVGLDVDTTTLLKSRRCSKDICTFVKQKLNIKIESTNKNTGKIIWLSEKKDILDILNNKKIIKLVWDNPSSYDFDSITWGYSKGDTYNEICVILTDTFQLLDSAEFILPKSDIAINRLYVALTRSSGNVYIIKKDSYNEFKK